MQHLLAGSMVDDEGRSTVELPTLFHLEGEEAEDAIESEMFAHATKFIWGIRMSSFIDPARGQILNEHHPSLRNLTFLVRNNPFVPPGHEGVFLRGIHAGFHGDFLVAAHLLVPQIENSMRHILTGNGVDVSNLMSDGTQPVKILGPLFDLEETKQIFGDSLCFELRGLLIQKTGCDFRNRIAHGFVSEAECFGHAAVNLWWLVLRLCLIPILQIGSRQTTDADDGDNELEQQENQHSMNNTRRSSYKYRSLYRINSSGENEIHPFTQSIFEKGEIYYATPSDFNDPYDCNLKLHVSDSTDQEWEDYLDKLIVRNPDDRDKLEKAKAIKAWKTNPSMGDGFGDSALQANYHESSVLCFSKKGNSVPMFSYYADDHRGIAIEFSFSDAKLPCGFLCEDVSDNGVPYGGNIVFRDVEYPEGFPELNYHRVYDSNQLVRSLIFTKLHEWSHEDEFRVFRRRVPASSVAFPKSILTRVIFGCRCNDDDIELVRSWLKSWPGNVVLAKAVRQSDTFELGIEDFEVVEGTEGT